MRFSAKLQASCPDSVLTHVTLDPALGFTELGQGPISPVRPGGHILAQRRGPRARGGQGPGVGWGQTPGCAGGRPWGAARGVWPLLQARPGTPNSGLHAGQPREGREVPRSRVTRAPGDLGEEAAEGTAGAWGRGRGASEPAGETEEVPHRTRQGARAKAAPRPPAPPPTGGGEGLAPQAVCKGSLSSQGQALGHRGAQGETAGCGSAPDASPFSLGLSLPPG